MHKIRLLASALLLLPLTTAAQEENKLRLRDIQSQGAKQLTAEELRALMPGARVTLVSGRGNTHIWDNNPDGKFTASSENKQGYGRQRPVSAPGTWQVADNGTYCVLIEWNIGTEQWCRFIFQAGDQYFGVRSVKDEATEAYRMSIKR